MSGAAKTTKTAAITRFFNVEATSAGKKRKAKEAELPTEAVGDAKVVTETNAEDIAAVASTAKPSLPITPIEEALTSSEELETIGWAPMDTLELSWKRRLLPETKKPYFQKLLKFLSEEARVKQTIFPPSDLVFTALNLCPFDQVKVVIIGQDPYHGPGQAHGLAFSVQKGVALPPSLRNMASELQADPAIRISPPTHGNLECWSRQGVLLLNAVLTVRKAEANSHQKKGWEEFTDAIVRELRKKRGVVYLLWGKPAQAKCSGIDGGNVILTCSHPSPLSAYKTNEPFIGSRAFSRCNDALQQLGKEPIDWTIR